MENLPVSVRQDHRSYPQGWRTGSGGRNRQRMTHHTRSPEASAAGQITLRGPAELADALPYLMGFHPDDSVVLVALHGEQGRFGARLRLGIPAAPEDWADTARQLADCLVTGSEKRGDRPSAMLVFLCQDPAGGESPAEVMERLRPLAQHLRVACGALDVPVLEALCISQGRYWSYCCPDIRCCPREGTPLGLRGTSVMAAAAAYAGIEVRGTLREMEARYAPLTSGAREQETALDEAAARLIPRILAGTDRSVVREETIALLARLIDRFRDASPVTGTAAADARDDALVDPGEAASALLGLQDRETRDRAAEWMEAPDAEPALRVWRALARRCAGAYRDHAAPPLTLAGWVAWSSGDEPAARVALALALRVDPDYLFARLLHQSANEGLDPELLRRCLREERAARETGRVAARDAGDARDARDAGDAREARDAGDAREAGDVGDVSGAVSAPARRERVPVPRQALPGGRHPAGRAGRAPRVHAAPGRREPVSRARRRASRRTHPRGR